MKHKIYALFAVIASIVFLTACDDDWNQNVSRQGSVRLSSMAIDVVTGEASRAGVDTSNFIIEIVSGDETTASWTYKNMPEILALPVGDYTARVKSHNVEPQQWDAPYYLGTKDFSITLNDICEIGTVTCRFSNIRVDVVFATDLMEHISPDSKVTVVAGDNANLDFTVNETRSGFFEAIDNSMTLVATFTGKIDNADTEIRNTYTNVAPGTHYVITYSLKATDTTIDDTGWVAPTSGISVSTSVVDDTVVGGIIVDEDPMQGVERPGAESPETPVEPDPETPVDPETPSAADISIVSATLSFDSPNIISDDLPGLVDIHSGAGFANLFVTIESDNANFMESVGGLMPTSFDLVNPVDASGTDWSEAYAGFGFLVGAEYDGKTDVPFDISTFIPLLGAFPGTHDFTLCVVDKNDAKLTKVLKFVAQ